MTTMDLKSICWVSDMYQRFESLCVEAEETVYQDTVKYVEDQMRTVGESVKKFYSDVMEDLLPPSSLERVKEENSTLTVVRHTDVAVKKKRKDDDGKESVNSETELVVKDSDGAGNGDNIVNSGSCCTAVCSGHELDEPTSGDTIEEQCTNEDLERQCSELDLSILATSAAKDLDNRQDSTCKSTSDTPSLNSYVTEDSGERFNVTEARDESNDSLCGLSDVNTSPNFVVSSTNADMGDTITFDAHSSEDIHIKLLLSDTELSNPLGEDETTSGDSGKHGFLLSEQLDKVKLGESCVLVEKSEHSVTLPLEHEQKSYKKKIRDVFSARRWSKGKRDQEQLAVWCELDENVLVPTTTSIKDSQSYESFESEWELL